MSSVQEIIASLASVADKPLSDPERFQLLGAMDKARIALEPPPFALQKLCFSPITLTVMRIAVGIRLFDIFAKNRDAPVAIEDVTSQAKGSKDLTVRVVRHLAVSGILEQVSPGKYKANPLGLICSSAAPGSDAMIHFYGDMKAQAYLNEFLENRNYENPGDAYDTPWQFAYNTDKLWFDFIAADPVRQRAFNTCQAFHDAYRPQDWFEFYPVDEKLKVQGDRVALVDIGGGTGTDIKKFQTKFPALGKLVLQDLPTVVSQVKDVPASIKVEAHDMLKPQTVKGAKAYYMRTILHDWPDKQARVALQNIKDAMSEDSILLLNENVMSDSNPSPMDTAVDFTMMAAFASRERTEKQWLDLIGSAGFRVVKIHRPSVAGPQTVALFEAVPA